jgi:tetratricopeptide (TPR) repeat protein
VLGDRFFETLRADQRRGDVEWLHERRQTLDRELLQPAMVHLEASRGVKLESAEFLEGLLALYRGDYDKALLYADRTLKLSPWLYEARKLKGDVLQARALVRLLAKENQRADADLVNAIAMYDDAAEVGRSDIAVFEARAEAWGQLLAQRYEARQSIASVFSTAVTACQRAITIAPNHVLSHRELAGNLSIDGAAPVRQWPRPSGQPASPGRGRDPGTQAGQGRCGARERARGWTADAAVLRAGPCAAVLGGGGGDHCPPAARHLGQSDLSLGL